MSECDVDDVLCHVETLRHLRGLQKELGKEGFVERFPQLEGIDATLANEIDLERNMLAEAVSRCDGALEELTPSEFPDEEE